jgi:hypothetical protein
MEQQVRALESHTTPQPHTSKSVVCRAVWYEIFQIWTILRKREILYHILARKARAKLEKKVYNNP